MRDLYRDGQRALGSLAVGLALPPLLGLLALIGCLAFGYCAGQRTGKQSLQVAARRDTVRLRDSVRVTIHDTVTVYLPRVEKAKATSDSLNKTVEIFNDSTVHVKKSPDSIQVVQVPAVIVADIRQLRLTVAVQDTLIGVLRRQTEADSQRIVARDRLIEALKPPRCGRRCGFLLGIGSAVVLYKAVK